MKFTRSSVTLPLVFSALALSLSVAMAATVLVRSDTDTVFSPDYLQRQEYLLAAGDNPHRVMFGDNQNLVADVAEQVAPSVVNIDVQRSRKVTQMGPQFFMNEDMMRRFFGFESEEGGPFQPFGTPAPGGRSPQVREQIITGNGSGVIIDKAGHILTNSHVVSGASKITVTLQNGKKLDATVIGSDRYTDLAVIKVNDSTLQPALMGSSARLRPGEWVLAVGSPLGFDHTVTIGIVSGISRRIPDVNANVEFIQTDAAINPGNSGGPLVNLKGEVVGINTAISGKGQNIGFAIPVDTVKEIASSLIRDGQINRPYIGIGMSELTPDVAKSLGLPESTQGVVVAQVMPNSPSDQAGFRQGDVIQRVDGKKVGDAQSVQELVRARPLHSQMNFQILREGQLMAIAVKTDQMPNGQAPNPKDE